MWRGSWLNRIRWDLEDGRCWRKHKWEWWKPHYRAKIVEVFNRWRVFIWDSTREKPIPETNEVQEIIIQAWDNPLSKS